MSLILQIETATSVCSIALSENGNVLVTREADQRNIHAEKITVFIDEALNAITKTYTDIDAIAVSSGPGSYTGLRIGVSVAKGLSYALDKPLIAVDTLAAMADGFIATHQFAGNILLGPMIDARRMEVFTAVFDVNGKNIRPTSAEIIDETSFGDLLTDNKIIFFGDGAAKCAEMLGVHANATIVVDFSNSAKYLSRRASEKYVARNFEDVAYFEPFYLKDFIAGKKNST